MKVENFETLSALKDFLQNQDVKTERLMTSDYSFHITFERNERDELEIVSSLKEIENPEREHHLSEEALVSFCRVLGYPKKNLKILSSINIKNDIQYLMHQLNAYVVLSKMSNEEKFTYAYEMITLEGKRKVSKKIKISNTRLMTIDELLKELNLSEVLKNRTMEFAQLTPNNFSMVLRKPDSQSDVKVGELISYDWKRGPVVEISNCLMMESEVSNFSFISGIQKREVVEDYGLFLEEHLSTNSQMLYERLPKLISTWKEEDLTKHTLSHFVENIQKFDYARYLDELKSFNSQSGEISVAKDAKTWDVIRATFLISTLFVRVLDSKSQKAVSIAGSYVNNYL